LPGCASKLDTANARAERAESAVAAERARADALRDQLAELQAELAVAQAAAGETETAKIGQAEAEAEADTAELRERVEALQAGQELMLGMHARALAEAAEQLSRVRDAAEGLRQAEQDRRARGLLARLRAGCGANEPDSELDRNRPQRSDHGGSRVLGMALDQGRLACQSRCSPAMAIKSRARSPSR
jgi:hypothetical protein